VFKNVDTGKLKDKHRKKNNRSILITFTISPDVVKSTKKNINQRILECCIAMED